MQSVAHEMGDGVSSAECRERIQEIKAELKQEGIWSAEEDAALDAAIAKHGKKWWLVGSASRPGMLVGECRNT